MNQSLEPWGEGAPDLVRDAASAYHREGPSELALDRMLLQVELGVASEAPGSAGLPTLQGKLGAKLLLSIAVVGTFVASVALVTLQAARVPTTMRSEPTVSVSRSDSAARESQAAPVFERSPTSAPALAGVNAARRDSGKSKAPKRTKAVPPDAAEELALLSRARRILVADPQRAYALTDEHRATYREGALGQERELLAIEALVRLARKDQALARAALFARRYPASVHARRLTLILDGRTP